MADAKWNAYRGAVDAAAQRVDAKKAEQMGGRHTITERRAAQDIQSQPVTSNGRKINRTTKPRVSQEAMGGNMQNYPWMNQ